MRIDFSTMKPRDIYHWMTSTIMPRPIAWVSTVSAEGKTNLAPFSFFQGISSAPPILMFVPANNRDGGRKHTLLNIEQVPEFVVNLVPHSLAEKMNATAALLPYGESEFDAFGIAAVPSESVRPPRVDGAPVAFECKLHSIVPMGEGPQAANVVFGSIQLMHIVDEAVVPGAYADAAKLDLIGRMGGELYVRTHDTFALKRPDR